LKVARFVGSNIIASVGNPDVADLMAWSGAPLVYEPRTMQLSGRYETPPIYGLEKFHSICIATMHA
jgi:hypothetical protein